MRLQTTYEIGLIARIVTIKTAINLRTRKKKLNASGGILFFFRLLNNFLYLSSHA